MFAQTRSLVRQTDNAKWRRGRLPVRRALVMPSAVVVEPAVVLAEPVPDAARPVGVVQGRSYASRRPTPDEGATPQRCHREVRMVERLPSSQLGEYRAGRVAGRDSRHYGRNVAGTADIQSDPDVGSSAQEVAQEWPGRLPIMTETCLTCAKVGRRYWD
jgi:hypothetical protein